MPDLALPGPQALATMDRRLTLPDGRKLAFREFGDVRAAPVFYFHGWPGSRLEPQAAINAALQVPLRLIAVDRPGYGGSDFLPGRQLAGWSSDVSCLADHLELRSFMVLGVSGGGPYALACAAGLPDRVRAAIVLCSMGLADTPDGLRGMALHNRLMLRVARVWPQLARAVVGCALNRHRKSGDLLPRALIRRLPAADRECLQEPGVRENLAANWREALRPGVRGALHDGLLFARPWGFRLDLVRPPVLLWHGEADMIVPPAMGRRLARELPNCRAEFLPGQGHFSLPFGHLPAILAAALPGAPATRKSA